MVYSEKNSTHELNECGNTPSFSELDPAEYYGLVTDAINYNSLADITRKLESIDLPKGVVIAAIGSDGKLERHTQSKTELIVLQESADLNGASILQDFFGKECYGELFDSGPDSMIDTKNLNENMPLAYAFNNPNELYPDRTLNMLPVSPISDDCLNLYFRARLRTLEEMSTNRHIKNKMKEQLASYRRSMNTGEYRRIPIFNTEQHVQHYSEMWPAYSTGFKTGFLRVVQRKLDLLTITLGNKKSWDEVAYTMPTTTIGRLMYLSDAGIISPEVSLATGDAYAWFLQQYHCIQEQYKQNGEPTELLYDPDLFEKYRESISYFSNLPHRAA
jgi:hypothetical protein